jgi:membrane dipeptidase
MINRGMFTAFAGSVTEYSRRTLDLIGRTCVIDMLAPLTLNGEEQMRWIAEGMTAEEGARFSGSGITGFHHALGLSGPNAFTDAMTYLAGMASLIRKNANVFTVAHSVAELKQAKTDGKAAVLLGIQNADHFRTVDDVKLFHDLGQRCSQLTYNTVNLLGAGATDRVDGGVSDFGAAIIARMNDVGMLVDVSHCGPQTTLDAIELSKGPIAITHSNCMALNDHPRLKSDEAIRKLAAKGGVIGMTGVRNFVRDREPTTIDHLIDHIDHVVGLVGIDHVGFGSDADLLGYDALPEEQQKWLRSLYKPSYGFRERTDIEGLDHPKKIFDLTEALIRRGYSDANIEAILGGNFARLLGTIIG